MRSFFRGLTSHLRALRLLSAQPRIRKLAAMPFIINVALFLIGLPVAVWASLRIVDGLFGDESWWLQALTLIVQVLVIVAVILAGIFLFTLIGTVIANPFNGPLSEAVEKHERQRRGLPETPVLKRGAARDAWRGIAYEIGRLILFLLLYPFIFVTQFIPGIGMFLHPLLAFFYATFVLSVDFSDPVLDRHLESFRDKLRYVWRRKGTYLGFGTGALLMMLIPFLNLLVIPVCVTAGTMQYIESSSSE